MNSVDKLLPFRYETQITDTESNSLKPSVSVNRNGSRMITWHDNRTENYNIFAARSLEGYECNQKECERSKIEAYESEIVECNISIDYTPDSTGVYVFSLKFYSDIELNNLYKTIFLDGTESRWFINNSSIESYLSYDDEGELLGVDLSGGEEINVSYIPDKNDGIFDVILYVKLNSVLS